MSIARILVVEDDAVVALDSHDRLKSLNYEVAGMASTGHDAVTQAESKRPDLVLMDISLPGNMNGIQAADKIRAKSNIPVIYVTAYADEPTLRNARATDPYGYILKPFDEIELRAAIEIGLHKHRIDTRLKKSEQWFATTLQAIGDGVIVFVNSVAEQLISSLSHLAFDRETDQGGALRGRTIDTSQRA